MLYLFLQTAVKAFSGLLALFALVAAGANLCFTGIHPAETSVFLRVAWPPTLAFPGDAFDVFAQAVLATNGWEVAGRVDVGHAFWEMRCRPVPELIKGISNSDFLNKRVGFYGDGFHMPDDTHLPDVEKNVPISKMKFLAGLRFCETFRTSTPRYSLSNYNCCNAMIDAAAACGVRINRTVKSWKVGRGVSPQFLGNDLKNNNWHHMR